MSSAIILGGGFAGTTVAHLLNKAGWSTTLVEKEHLGGGCRTFFYGGHPFTYGPRVYYGYSQKVFEWLNSFVKIRRFPFELKAYVEGDGRFYTYPIHEADLPEIIRRHPEVETELAQRDNSKEPKDFEEYWINRVGKTLYDMFVNQYSKKMWMIGSNTLFDIFKWSAKDKPIETGTREAYKGSYIGYPVAHDGYNHYFDAMVEGTEVVNGSVVWVDQSKRYVRLDNQMLLMADVIVSTIPVDELFGHSLGELPYVGRDFDVFVLPCKQVFPGDVRFCHYDGMEPHTRITEFKKLTYYESEDTLLVKETPSKRNKLYPYLTKANMALVDAYLGRLGADVYSIGRLGTYKYSTIEQTIVQAFQVVAKITGRPNAMEDQFFGIGDTSMMKDRKGES